MMSVPVDKSRADVWISYPGTRSVDLGRPLPERWIVRAASHPEVERAEGCIMGFSVWMHTPPGSSDTVSEVCTVIGTRLDPNSLAAVEAVRTNPDYLALLSEPRTVVVDEGELGRLGIRGVGDVAEIFGTRVRVVGLVNGYRS